MTMTETFQLGLPETSQETLSIKKELCQRDALENHDGAPKRVKEKRETQIKVDRWGYMII